MYELRTIAPSELPTVTMLDGSTVPASDQDLMNMGVFHIEGDVYACIGVFADGRGQHKSADQLPGTVISAGYLQQRHAALPGGVRAAVMKATVYRHKNPIASLRHLVNDNSDPDRLRARVPALGGSARPANVEKALDALAAARDLAVLGDAEQLTVAMADVQDGDVVEVDSVVPLEFAGERRVRG